MFGFPLNFVFHAMSIGWEPAQELEILLSSGILK